MAMRTASPYWLSLVLVFGLLLVLIGERLTPVPSVRVVLTGIGITLIGLVTAARLWTATGASGPRRQIERVLLLCSLATIAALVLYAMTTSWGPDSFQEGRAKGMVTVIWAILLVASLVPVLLIEVALGAALRSGFDLKGDPGAEANVDLLRVRDQLFSGLSIAFAMAFLMVTCQVAKERNVSRDYSYFKTSLAGESTQNIVKASSEPLHALLFFQDQQEALGYVKGYFDQLGSASGNLQVSVHDRLAEATLAEKFSVTKDGTIVLARAKEVSDAELVKATKYGTVTIPEKELDNAEQLRRSQTLRELDSKVNKELLKLMREKRKAYVMTGHGELNDPDSVPAELKGTVPERRTTRFKQALTDSQYEVKDLGLIDLAKDVPEDATIVIMLAPTLPLHDAEWAALARYLDRGGRMLIALDPKADPSLGPLEQKLGIKYNPAPLTDDVAYLPQRGTKADRRFAITTQFSAHASTTTLSRTVDKGLILIEAGALEEIASNDAVDQRSGPPKKTVTLRSMESSWLDTNDNFAFDEGAEQKQKWNIGIAVEGSKLADGKDGYRVLVYSDADLFADALVQNAMRQAAVVLVSGPLLRDSILWLGGEEVFAGEIVSETDKPIEHTRNEEAVWFILTVLGVPLLVLGLGLGGTLYLRRRRAVIATKKEVTP
jgi:hypothetical protein